MRHTTTAALVAMLWLGNAALAQTIEELPPDVFRAAEQLEKKCTKAGGFPKYEPLELVTFAYFGKDWNNGGRESYVIDTSRIECSGAQNPQPWCSGDGCNLIVMVPSGSTAFTVGFDQAVTGWQLLPRDADNAETDLLLEVEIQGSKKTYKAGDTAMVHADATGE